MKKREVHKITSGGLFLLLFLLSIHCLCTIFCCSADVDVQSSGDDYTVYKGEMTAFHKITLGIPVSINAEGSEDLTAVPWIGPKIAGLIIREREKRGGFKRLDELKSIHGIGPALYGKIRPYLAL